jgi:hypothetical protein
LRWKLFAIKVAQMSANRGVSSKPKKAKSVSVRKSQNSDSPLEVVTILLDLAAHLREKAPGPRAGLEASKIENLLADRKNELQAA